MCVFFTQMGTLNEEVSVLNKGLHHMMHLLQAHISMQHYKAYPYGLQMVSMPTSVPSTDMSFNPSSTYHLHNDPTSFGLQSAAHAGRWGCSAAAAESRTVTHQQTQRASPPASSCSTSLINSGPRPAPCHGSESITPHQWTSPSLLNIGPRFQDEGPAASPHAGHESSDNRPLSASPAAISQSQPTLCLQPPCEGGEFSCLLTSAPTGTSAHSLLDSSPSSPNVKISQDKQEDICVLLSATTSHNVMEDSTIFQIKDSCPPMLPVSASPTLSSLPGPESSPDPAPSQSDAHDPRLPLCDPSAIEHTSLECLLGNGGFMESRDSESASSRRSSIGVQTQSTEQSWCLDLTD